MTNKIASHDNKFDKKNVLEKENKKSFVLRCVCSLFVLFFLTNCQNETNNSSLLNGPFQLLSQKLDILLNATYSHFTTVKILLILQAKTNSQFRKAHFRHFCFVYQKPIFCILTTKFDHARRLFAMHFLD